MNTEQDLTPVYGRTTVDCVILQPWGAAMAKSMQVPITVPAGTRVVAVDCCMGGYIWAIESVRVAAALTHDSYMATTRYVYIEPLIVKEDV